MDWTAEAGGHATWSSSHRSAWAGRWFPADTGDHVTSLVAINQFRKCFESGIRRPDIM